MIVNEKNINSFFYYWLNFCLLLVFLIIIVGGLTRLTNSGLSITEWELFRGILPPINDISWELYFDKYKEIPQFKFLNNNMTLDEFKIIFYWEYFHRILARLIGLFFLIPFIYFLLTKQINKKYISICHLIFFMILLQGIVGWFMVESGLTKDVTVSHYRLSIHLSLAFLIIGSIFWLIKNFKYKTTKFFFYVTKENIFFLILIFLILFQVISGAFVSGLDAGRIYQTWPLMGRTYFPSDVNITNLKNIIDFNNHSLVQFYHRNLAYLITVYILILSIYIFKNKLKILFKPLMLMIIFLSIQIILGVLTLISGLNIYLASAHQICSVILVFSSINLYYFRVK